MAIEDYFDPYSYDDEEDQPSEKFCKFCGKGNLRWVEDDGKWMLVDITTNEIHKCIKKKPQSFSLNQAINTLKSI